MLINFAVRFSAIVIVEDEISRILLSHGLLPVATFLTSLGIWDDHDICTASHLYATRSLCYNQTSDTIVTTLT
jgi:hypothetical protein